MRKILLALTLAMAMFTPSFAEDLNFSAFNKPVAMKTNFSLIENEQVKAVSEFDYSLSYADAIELAKKTGKVIVITKDVEGDKEISAQCQKDGTLYVNGNDNNEFYVGLSKVEVIGGKAMYVELPSSAFPEREQGVQYKINRDAMRSVAKQNAKVSVPQKAVEINLDQPRWYNMDGTPYIPQQGVQMMPMQSFQADCGPGG